MKQYIVYVIINNNNILLFTGAVLKQLKGKQVKILHGHAAVTGRYSMLSHWAIPGKEWNTDEPESEDLPVIPHHILYERWRGDGYCMITWADMV